jgi:DNA-binding transcriptional LysR family regulator
VVSASPEWRFERQGKARAVRLEPRLRVNNVEAALAAMLAGAASAGRCPTRWPRTWRTGGWSRLLPDFEPPPLPVHLVTVGGRFMPPLVRAFLDHAVPRLEGLAVLREEAS